MLQRLDTLEDWSFRIDDFAVAGMDDLLKRCRDWYRIALVYLAAFVEMAIFLKSPTSFVRRSDQPETIIGGISACLRILRVNLRICLL